MKLIFLGPPGAGKGTQAERIAERYRIAHISTGDMLRSEIRNATALGAAAKSYLDRGELVPDSVIIDMVRERIQREDCRNGFLLDGFPRTVAQAEALSGLTDVDFAVNIDVPSERLVKRISGRRMCPDCGAAYHVSMYAKPTCQKCGATLYQRDDDREETVKNRLKVYTEQTAPLIDYYRRQGILRTVNCQGTVEENFAQVKRALEA